MRAQPTRSSVAGMVRALLGRARRLPSRGRGAATSAAATALALLLAAAASAASASAAQAPKAGTYAGSIGQPLPRGAVAGVRAVNLVSGVVESVGTVSRSGAFSLAVPAGPYAVVGTVVPRRGAVAEFSAGVRLKGGQRVKQATLKKRPRTPARKGKSKPTHKGKPTPKGKRGKSKSTKSKGRAAYVSEQGQATPGVVAVQQRIPYATSGGASEYVRGSVELAISRAINASRERCGLAEIDPGADELADRFVRFVRGERVNRVVGDVEVRGSLTQTGGDRVDAAIAIVDKRSGETIATVKGAVGASTFGPDLERLVRKVGDQLCKLSDVYEVRLDVEGWSDTGMYGGQGTIASVLRAVRPSKQSLTWNGLGAWQWANQVAFPKTECLTRDLIMPAPQPWTAKLTAPGPQGPLTVTVGLDTQVPATLSLDCPPSGEPPYDPPPIPGLTFLTLLNPQGTTFTLPVEGGVAPISATVASADGGFFARGTVTVKPTGVQRSDPEGDEET